MSLKDEKSSIMVLRAEGVLLYYERRLSAIGAMAMMRS